MADDVTRLVRLDDELVPAPLHGHRTRERRDQRVSAVHAAVDDADADASPVESPIAHSRLTGSGQTRAIAAAAAASAGRLQAGATWSPRRLGEAPAAPAASAAARASTAFVTWDCEEVRLHEVRGRNRGALGQRRCRDGVRSWRGRSGRRSAPEELPRRPPSPRSRAAARTSGRARGPAARRVLVRFPGRRAAKALRRRPRRSSVPVRPVAVAASAPAPRRRSPPATRGRASRHRDKARRERRRGRRGGLTRGALRAARGRRGTRRARARGSRAHSWPAGHAHRTRRRRSDSTTTGARVDPGGGKRRFEVGEHLRTEGGIRLGARDEPVQLCPRERELLRRLHPAPRGGRQERQELG